MAKHPTIRGGGARLCIVRKEEFTAEHNTVFGKHQQRWDDSVDESDLPRSYAVYSYGMHFPMFVFDYDTQQWFETAEQAPSPTTARHLNQCRPHDGLTKLSKVDLCRVIELGYVALARKRVAGDVS